MTDFPLPVPLQALHTRESLQNGQLGIFPPGAMLVQLSFSSAFIAFPEDLSSRPIGPVVEVCVPSHCFAYPTGALLFFTTFLRRACAHSLLLYMYVG